MITLPANAYLGDSGWIPGWEDPLEESIATLQYSCLKNSLAGCSPQGCTESDRLKRTFLMLEVLYDIKQLEI